LGGRTPLLKGPEEVSIFEGMSIRRGFGFGGRGEGTLVKWKRGRVRSPLRGSRGGRRPLQKIQLPGKGVPPKREESLAICRTI